ncbi:hypothetical protein ACWDTI_05225 [Gordonia sp. NPDC003424]
MPLPDTTALPDDLAGRRLVVGVGSNTSPAVLRSKLSGLGETISPPLIRVRVRGIAVGHSAHVSARGYIPAAPYRSPGAVLDTVAALLTDDEVAALDRTEPNYRRMTLTPEHYPIDATPVVGQPFSLYASNHGVLVDPNSGGPLPLGTQARVISWLGDRLTDDSLSGPAAEVCRRLGEPAVAARLTAAFRTSGLSADADLVATPHEVGVGR